MAMLVSPNALFLEPRLHHQVTADNVSFEVVAHVKMPSFVLVSIDATRLPQPSRIFRPLLNILAYSLTRSTTPAPNINNTWASE